MDRKFTKEEIDNFKKFQEQMIKEGLIVRKEINKEVATCK